ncbi:PPE family protein [Mycobacterium sp.]|uniref:PPE family protein n=1 Tax=Mycobacterium sp. TaxID=1785 RepID=UPI003BAADE57
MDFAMLPPEINSGRMYTGPGSGPMLLAATAWEELAAELDSTAASYDATVSGLAAGPWLGPASASMEAAAAPYIEWLNASAARATQAAAQAKAAVAAYEAAFAMTIPPPVIAANRSLLMTLVATNILGQNTPAIAANETQYEQMWAQDAAAMYGYAGQSAAASALTPFSPVPLTTNLTGAAGQAAAVEQSIIADGPQVISALAQALQALATPAASALPLSSLSPLVSGSGLAGLSTILSLIIIPLTAIDLPIAATSATASATSATASLTSAGTTVRGLEINADRDFAKGDGPFTGHGPGGHLLPQWLFGGPSTAPPVSAGMGQGNAVGKLSVPSAWTVAAPALRSVAYALPSTGPAVSPPAVTATSGSLFPGMALAGAAGYTMGSDERFRAAGQGRLRPLQRQRPEEPTEIATELRELAERAQSLLAKLANSGLMTNAEVIEQRQRFPD